MSETQRIPNFSDLNLKERSYVSVAANSAQAILNVTNAAGFLANDFVWVGPNFGSEIAEIKQIQSITGNQLTFTGNLSNNHAKLERVVKLFGDKVKLYSSANIDGSIPADSTFTTVIGSAPIQADDMFTDITDSAGSSLYWYKAVYLNSFTNNETSLSQSVAIRGGGYGHYVSIEDIRRECGLTEDIQIDDTQVATRRMEAEDIINGMLRGAGYVLPLVDSKNNAYTPPLIENACRLLAAGMILVQDYGPTAVTDTKDGEGKMKEAYDIMDKIAYDDIVLLDEQYNQLQRTNRVLGYPDNTTTTSGPQGNPEPQMFPMDKVY